VSFARGWRLRLAQRSKRKRRRPTAATQPRVGTGNGLRPPVSGPSVSGAGERRTSERRLRGEERDAAIRAQLEPLTPGERPLAITLASIAAGVIGIANFVLWAAGYEVRGNDQSAAGVIVFSALILIAAVGMWQMRYWAVLGFQALLGITIVTAGLSLLLVGNLQGALVALVILVPACALFWSLIRPMARLRMPARPGR
jgi:hypothetical protein